MLSGFAGYLALLLSLVGAGEGANLSLQAAESLASVPLIDAMPARPANWRVLDWQQRARDFDQLAFDEQASGPYLPLLHWIDAGKSRFLLPSYVGQNPPGGEAICALAAVLSGELAGVDKTNDRGTDWVRLTEPWFNGAYGVASNNVGWKNPGGSFWYLVLPGVLYTQLALRHPEREGMQGHLRAMADRYREIVLALGGAQADFNHTGYDFAKNAPWDNQRWKEPDAAAGIAYIEYAAWSRWHRPEHLEAARWCLDFLERRQPEEGNPLYETLLHYAPALAAKCNAEHGAHYDVGKLLNWCLSDNSAPRTARPDWGILARSFGDTEVYGLQGSTHAGSGYVFAMNTFNAAGALAPLARYDERFAAPLAKWLTHVANNARWFFSDEAKPERQSNPELRDTALKAVPYEGVREVSRGSLVYTLRQTTRGTADADANLKLHRKARGEAQFRCDAEGRLSTTLEIEVPPEATGGSWHIDARLVRSGAAFRVSSGPTADGPWQDCGGFGGRTLQADGILAAGGPLKWRAAGRSVWLKLESSGAHPANEPLMIRSFGCSATLGISPWSSGDSFSNGHGPTDLAPYGGAYIGYLAALVRKTEYERVLAFDLSATDFLGTPGAPLWLCYNADTEARTLHHFGAKPVSIPPGGAVFVRPEVP